MKKHRFSNASVMERKFLSGEIWLIVGEAVDCPGEAVRDGRYFVLGDGRRVHCKYVEGDKVSVMMSYKDAGLSESQFGHLRGWENRKYASDLYMPNFFVVRGVRCVRVSELSDADILRSGVYVNQGGNYMVGGSVGGWERSAADAFRRMAKIAKGTDPLVVVYDIVPVIGTRFVDMAL